MLPSRVVEVKDDSMAAKQNFICACFFTRNYFIPQVSMHVNFIDASHFIEEYLEVWRAQISLLVRVSILSVQ